MVKSILIVDDDQEMLSSLKSGFAKYQDTFAVQTAKDGFAAVDALKNSLISLVVTDLKMPRMDGFELLEHIMQQYPEIPVIVITGYSTPDMEKLALEGGAVGYIAKPFMLDNLARHIMATLRKESDGGTLHSVSSGIFLQLMEMEQKTCTIRLEDKKTGKKGVLFFQDGELLDARVDHRSGKAAAYDIFAWDKVTISIQNECPRMENKIQSDLQPLILEATRLRDEAEEKRGHGQKEELVSPAPPRKPKEPIAKIRELLIKEFGTRGGVQDIISDNIWSDFIEQMTTTGEIFHTGRLKLGYIDKGEDSDYIVLADNPPVVITVSPKCPRDKMIQVLSR